MAESELNTRREAAAKAQMIFDDLRVLRSSGDFSRALVEVCKCGTPQYTVFDGDVEIPLDSMRRDPNDTWAQYKERETLQEAIREYDARAGISEPVALKLGTELVLDAVS